MLIEPCQGFATRSGQHTLASRRDAIAAFLAANQRMPE
jgi:hypothetical protein